MMEEEFAAQVTAAKSKLKKKSLQSLTNVLAKFASFTLLLPSSKDALSTLSTAQQFPFQIVAVLKRFVIVLSTLEKVAPLFK